MKKQLAILILGTTMLTGCHHLCEECAGGKCDITPAIAAEDITHQMVLNKTSHFAFDSAALSEQAKADLKPLIERLKENANEKVMIKGYTDITGPAAYNQTLSEQRAMSVKDYLISEGIAANRIETKGYGASHFIATNETPAGRAQNRRTEVVCWK
ncbi:MAG: OmpA family protein [Alphaproteobacteria bacterium]|nr:OmpA family protein [Alphaproteobacteria bacterium]